MSGSRRVASKSVKAGQPAYMQYVVLIPYFDLLAKQSFCWWGRVTAKDEEAARKCVKRFLADKESMMDSFIMPRIQTIPCT